MHLNGTCRRRLTIRAEQLFLQVAHALSLAIAALLQALALAGALDLQQATSSAGVSPPPPLEHSRVCRVQHHSWGDCMLLQRQGGCSLC
jgi:hypothetical protein